MTHLEIIAGVYVAIQAMRLVLDVYGDAHRLRVGEQMGEAAAAISLAAKMNAADAAEELEHG